MPKQIVNRSDNGLHLRIYEANSLIIGPEWNSPDVQSRYWRLYINRSNGASLILESGDFILEENKVYLVPAMVRFSCRNTRTINHLYVHFDVIGISHGALRALWNQPVLVPDSENITGALRHLITDDEAGPDNLRSSGMLRECALKSVIYASMASCLDKMSAADRAREEKRALEAEVLRPALDAIDDNYSTALSVKMLASLCVMSPDAFARHFSGCMGQPPAQYILEYRITKAAQMLLFTSDTIERISEATGFGNRFYFSRQFRCRTGLSPAAFRRSGQTTK